VLKFHFISQQFLLVGEQGLVLSPGVSGWFSLRYLRYATDIHTTGFSKVCNLELCKPSFTSSLSREDENIFPKDNK